MSCSDMQQTFLTVRDQADLRAAQGLRTVILVYYDGHAVIDDSERELLAVIPNKGTLEEPYLNLERFLYKDLKILPNTIGIGAFNCCRDIMKKKTSGGFAFPKLKRRKR